MTDPDIELGAARRSDISTIAILTRDLVEQGLAWSWTSSRVGARMRAADTLVVVARAEDAIAGFGIMSYGEDDAHLELLGVTPPHRRSGVGRKLVEWLEKPARLAGISRVSLEVRRSNEGARTFYERLGYRVVGEIPLYYQRRESALRMRREFESRAVPFEIDVTRLG